MSTTLLALTISPGLAGSLSSCTADPVGCVAALQRLAVLLGLALVTTGLCYLALWILDLVSPSPRCGATLLLVSAIGAIALFPWGGIAPAAELVLLAVVAAPLLLLTAMLMLLAQGKAGSGS